MGTDSSSDGVPGRGTDVGGDPSTEDRAGEQSRPSDRPSHGEAAGLDEDSSPAEEPQVREAIGPPASEAMGPESEDSGSRRPGADREQARSDQSASDNAGSRGQPGQPIEAHFANPKRQKPQRYNRGRSKVHPTTPLDPITPYMAGPVPRRRKSDWPILVFAMVVAAIVMATCCVAGFAIFRTYGLSF